MNKDSFRFIDITTEPKCDYVVAGQNTYGIFHNGKLLVFKKSNTLQINSDKRVGEMMIPIYEKATGLKLTVKHIPVIFKEQE